jgi:hypothetical protein
LVQQDQEIGQESKKDQQKSKQEAQQLCEKAKNSYTPELAHNTTDFRKVTL